MLIWVNTLYVVRTSKKKHITMKNGGKIWVLSDTFLASLADNKCHRFFKIKSSLKANHRLLVQ